MMIEIDCMRDGVKILITYLILYCSRTSNDLSVGELLVVSRCPFYLPKRDVLRLNLVVWTNN